MIEIQTGYCPLCFTPWGYVVGPEVRCSTCRNDVVPIPRTQEGLNKLAIAMMDRCRAIASSIGNPFIRDEFEIAALSMENVEEITRAS